MHHEHYENVLEPIGCTIAFIILTAVIVRYGEGDVTACFITVLGAATCVNEARRRLMHNLEHMREHKHITAKEELL